MDPGQFIGIPGCENEDQVKQAFESIVRYAWHAALNHDIGKLFIIDTVSMYGRTLLDDEFLLIKSHPVSGAGIASEHVSTRDYVDVIKGHHLWYDCTKGYPAGFDTFRSCLKINT